jgi:hypothetical protein
VYLLLFKHLTVLFAGFITAQERTYLNEIYHINPLLFEVVLKRTLKGPNGEMFPKELFLMHPELQLK